MQVTDGQRLRRSLAAVVLAALVALGPAGPAMAEPQGGDSRARVEGAFLVNFIRVTEWPRSRFAGDGAPCVLVVVGSEAVADAVREVAHAAGTVQGRRIEVRQVDGDRMQRQRDVLRAAHVVFVDRSGGVAAEDAIDLLQGAPILTVGDSAGFVRAGGMLGLVVSGSRVGFVANPGAIRQGGLTVSAKVLKLARDTTP